MLPNVHGLSCSFLDFLDTLSSFHVYVQTELWWLNGKYNIFSDEAKRNVK